MIGAAFAAACCLGVAAALSLLTSIGAGFLIKDAILIPLYLALLALSVWLLYRSARAHGKFAPAWVGLAAAIVAFGGLWIATALVYTAIAVFIAASAWDFWRGRRLTSS